MLSSPRSKKLWWQHVSIVVVSPGKDHHLHQSRVPRVLVSSLFHRRHQEAKGRVVLALSSVAASRILETFSAAAQLQLDRQRNGSEGRQGKEKSIVAPRSFAQARLATKKTAVINL